MGRERPGERRKLNKGKAKGKGERVPRKGKVRAWGRRDIGEVLVRVIRVIKARL